MGPGSKESSFTFNDEEYVNNREAGEQAINDDPNHGGFSAGEWQEWQNLQDDVK